MQKGLLIGGGGGRIIDEFCLLEGDLTQTINKTRIDSYHARYLISYSCKRWHLRFFASTNAATIITRFKLAILLYPRIKGVFLLNPHITLREALLLLARAICPKRFDSLIDSVDFLDSRVVITQELRREVCGFLQSELRRLGFDDFLCDKSSHNTQATLQSQLTAESTSHSDDKNCVQAPMRQVVDSRICFTLMHRLQIESTRPKRLRNLTLAKAAHIIYPREIIENINDKQNKRDNAPAYNTLNSLFHHPLSVSNGSTPLYLVLINPFSISATHTLAPHMWLKLIDKVGAMLHCVPIVCTFGKEHNAFMDLLDTYTKLHKLESNPLHNRCIIYHNRGTIHHLAALVSQMSVVISGSTGTLHLASNLYIPTIALVSQRDTQRWGSQDKRYCILPAPLHEITQEEQNTAIQETLSLLESLLHA